MIEAFVKASKVDPSKVIAHFDEWTTAMGLLKIKAEMPQIATVFTTHATSIGRSICGNGKPLYDHLEAYNGDQMAAELNMQSKHSLEKAAALNADCFTTVSDVTAREAEVLLDKKPDVVTPNGFELNFVPAKTRYTAARKAARKSLLGVASALTGVDYADDTFIVAAGPLRIPQQRYRRISRRSRSPCRQEPSAPHPCLCISAHGAPAHEQTCASASTAPSPADRATR